MQTLNQIRTTFLDYFKGHDHEVVASSPLVPKNDPTLLFTSAGMVQFKDVFTGIDKRPYSRATTAQKCVRAGGKHNDLENVGYTARHHTFFEMLGNFSFGDYFKEKAIVYAWELITKIYGLDQSRLWLTVYESDDESHELWRKVTGFADHRIIRIATSDNFWAMGDTGPCGPCTEIFYDHGDHIPGGLPGTPDADGDRYTEIWNLVFMQFESLNDGSRVNLPKPCVDTGMGLERLASVLQGKHDNYDIDLFQGMIDESQALTGNTKLIHSHRVVADHMRSSAFLMADGVLPSNEGRGYVLRRIMRRAMRHVHLLGSKEPLMHRLVTSLVSLMGDAYPELKRAQPLIRSTLLQEEEKFRETLDRGMKLLNQEVEKTKGQERFPGDVAFNLYDTYGFPVDLTQDILKEHHLDVDMDAFDKAMAQQKEKARAAWVGSGEVGNEQKWFDYLNQFGPSIFLGYDTLMSDSKVLAVDKIGEMTVVLLDQTPFYGEAGGQVGDNGTLTYQGKEYLIVDTQKKLGKLHAHFLEGDSFLKPGDVVSVCVDKGKRQQIKANHTATHLLHAALRSILGEHVTQKGSLVAADRLRFDFAYPKALSNEQITAVEHWVNEKIWAHRDVDTQVLSMDDAIAKGAIALFGEKYDDQVRVVHVQDDQNSVSLELCGGTHVNNTGAIGVFKIVSEAGIASGIRRIEAMTQKGVYDYIVSSDQTAKTIQDLLKCSLSEAVDRVRSLLEDRKNLQANLHRLRGDQAKQDILANAKTIQGIHFLSAQIDHMDVGEAKTLVEPLLKNKEKTLVMLGLVNDSKASVIVGVSKDLADTMHAAEIVRQASPFIGGTGGGGRKDFAQGGGSNPEGIPAMFDALIEFLENLPPL